MRRTLGLVFFLVGCGSGGGSGVPRDLLMNQLTVEQSTAVCKAGLTMVSFDDATIRGYCATKLSGQSDCAAQLDACITTQKASIAMATDPATHCTFSASDPPAAHACAITVGTYEDCEADFAQAFASTYTSATCDHPATTEPSTQSSTACQTITKACPQDPPVPGGGGKR